MKRTYLITYGLDSNIALSIDTDKETAERINEFWSDAEYLDGDVFEAVARRAASQLLRFIFNGLTRKQAVDALHDLDGWPSPVELRIEVIDYDYDDWSSHNCTITEI